MISVPIDDRKVFRETRQFRMNKHERNHFFFGIGITILSLLIFVFIYLYFRLLWRGAFLVAAFGVGMVLYSLLRPILRRNPPQIGDTSDQMHDNPI
jgi:hypothetical protein